MEQFVHQANIEHYRKLLAQTAEESARVCIQRLLDEETEKDRQPTEK